MAGRFRSAEGEYISKFWGADNSIGCYGVSEGYLILSRNIKAWGNLILKRNIKLQHNIKLRCLT